MSPVHLMHLRSNWGGWGGPEGPILSLASRADPAGFEVTLASFRDPAYPRNPLIEAAGPRGVRVALLHWSRWNPYPVALWELHRLLRRERVHLLHVHDAMTTILGWAASRIGGPPVVATVHGWIRQPLRVRAVEAVARNVLGRLAAVIAVSQALGQELIRGGVPAGRIQVVRYGIEPREVAWDELRDSARKDLGLNPDAPVVGMIGRLSEEKGPRILLRAIPMVLEQVPHARFLMVGAGPLEAMVRAEARRAGLDGRLILTGFKEDITPYLACLDLLVLPSLTEGLPLALLEGMSAGKPIVATAVGGVPELVADGKTGVLVPPGDAASLAAAIGGLLLAPQRAREMGQKAGEVFREGFSVERMVQATEALYRRVLGSGGEGVSG